MKKQVREFHEGLQMELGRGDLVRLTDGSVLQVTGIRKMQQKTCAGAPLSRAELFQRGFGKPPKRTKEEPEPGMSDQAIQARVIRRGRLLRAFHLGVELLIPREYAKGMQGRTLFGNREQTFPTDRVLVRTRFPQKKQTRLPIETIVQGEELAEARRKLPWLARALSGSVRRRVSLEKAEVERKNAAKRASRDYARRKRYL